MNLVKGNKVGSRRRSREIALQILYQMEVTETAPDEAINRYYELAAREEEEEDVDEATPEIPMAVRPFAEQIVYGVEVNRDEIDRLIASASQHWRIERMSIVDRSILRLAVFEMLHCPDIPPKVSINEAIDLGKTFGSPESGSFINGILDQLMLQIDRKDKPKDDK